MTTIRAGSAGLVASVVFVLGLFHSTSATNAAKEIILVNAKASKCVTIAGGMHLDSDIDAQRVLATAHAKEKEC